MIVPEVVAVLLDGRPTIGVEEQAFPFLTVDDAGFPHVALLSRAELGPSADRGELFAVLRSSRTRRNLRRDGRCGLIAFEGMTAHYLKLEVRDLADEDGFLGLVLEVVHHKADSLGIGLHPVTFTPTDTVAAVEHWDRTRAVLERLAVR